jgi:hypothetical protein
MQRATYRMMKWGLALGLAAWLLSSLLGCCGWHKCGKNTKLDYGRSVTHNIAASLVNPEAGQEVYVSRGQTPEAAGNAYDKYNKSFKAEEKKGLMQMLTTGGGGGGY